MNSDHLLPVQPRAEAPVCPMHGIDEASAALQAHDVLVFPMHKRAIVQYAPGESGATELFLYYFDKEVSFDEPDLFAFGESLANHGRFTGSAAMGWGGGYAWERVGPLLEHLLAEGILEHEDPAAPAPRRPAATDGARPSPLPPAQTAMARTWFECESITRELAGHAVESGHLELVIPVFRIAHMAMDAEGRQVGEANVFPKALRLDIPTRWRTCIYSGSRYLDERPMNVSALKSMRAHWLPMMSLLSHLREAYLRRFPAARTGWTVGDLECLSTLVLAVPTFQLVRYGSRVENGELHPVLSSVFRVTDGLRMTSHQMLFVPVAEATLDSATPITSREVYAYAERNHAFASTHGVCAGPQSMIEEFLAVLVDGRQVAGASGVVFDPQVRTALQQVEQAFDYGLLGLQAHVAVFSLWPVMTRTYARLHAIAAAWSGAPGEALQQLRAHLQQKADILQNATLHATEEWRANRERVYAEIFTHGAIGLGEAGASDLATLIGQVPRTGLDDARQSLRAHLLNRLSDGSPLQNADAARLLDCLMDYFSQAQGILAVAGDVQARINVLLGRPVPRRAFTAADIDVHVVLQGSEARRLPHLLNEMQALLGFQAEITRDAVRITTPLMAPRASMRAGATEFAGTGPADKRALCTST